MTTQHAPLSELHFTTGKIEGPYPPDDLYSCLITFADGRVWEIEGPYVEMRIDQIEGMSDAEIGAAVRRLSGVADFLDVLSRARQIVDRSAHSTEEFNELLKQRGKFVTYRGMHLMIDLALTYLDRGYQRPQKIPEKATPGFVYLIRGPSQNYKIGRSRNVQRRVADLQAATSEPLTLLHSIHTSDAAWAERAMHERFASSRASGEWFALPEADISWFCSLTSFERPGGAR